VSPGGLVVATWARRIEVFLDILLVLAAAAVTGYALLALAVAAADRVRRTISDAKAYQAWRQEMRRALDQAYTRGYEDALRAAGYQPVLSNRRRLVWERGDEDFLVTPRSLAAPEDVLGPRS